MIARMAAAFAAPDGRHWRWLYAALVGVLALNFLYLARGEGERSAMYLYPFLIAPAAHALAEICGRERRTAALWTVLAFLAGQTLLTEMLFYTYW